MRFRGFVTSSGVGEWQVTPTTPAISELCSRPGDGFIGGLP